ncbi:MAG TPA: hypothetical protein VGE52_02730 [Pirellulales bacterium]
MPIRDDALGWARLSAIGMSLGYSMAFLLCAFLGVKGLPVATFALAGVYLACEFLRARWLAFKTTRSGESATAASDTRLPRL